MRVLLVDLKLKDTEEVSWRKGLSNYLKRAYGSQQWRHFYDKEFTLELDHIRNNANGELSPEILLEQNYMYYAYLEQLNRRLGKNTSKIGIEFVWYESELALVRECDHYRQHSIAFEKSCTLFNIGVLHTIVGKEELDNDEKAALKSLTRAVECFLYISKNFLNSPSSDLQAKHTSFLADLCQAEAQELFLTRLINGENPAKQASLIGRLCFECSNIYKRCNDFTSSVINTTGGLEYGDSKWNSIISSKFYAYQGLSAYYYAISLEQQGKVGQGIAYMTLARNKILSSMPNRVYLNEYIDIAGLLGEVEKSIEQMTKDNDFIYHEAIPLVVELESIAPLNAIKLVEWIDQLGPYLDKVSNKSERIFKGIVPIEMYEKESLYSEEKASLLRIELENSETADIEYSSFVELTNLVKLLKDLENQAKGNSATGFMNPEVELMRKQLSAWSEELNNHPDRNIQQQMDIFVKRRNDILEILSKIPEYQKENVTKLKSSLVAASKSDEMLFTSIKDQVQRITLLANKKTLMETFDLYVEQNSNENSLLDIDDNKTEAILQEIDEVRRLADDLKILKEERGRNIDRLRAELAKDNIVDVLLLHSGNSDQELKMIFEKELEKFRPISYRIETTIMKQGSIIGEIKQKLDHIFYISGFKDKSEHESRLSAKRNVFFEQMKETYSKFMAFSSDLVKGKEFYNSLLSMSRELQQYTNTKIPGAFQAVELPLQQPIKQYDLPNMMQSMTLTPDAGPHIPPRNYMNKYEADKSNAMGSDSQESGYTPDGSIQVPPLPPKYNTNSVALSMQKREQAAKEESELQINPTAFYNKPSVFDENMYSKFSGK